MTSIGRDFLLTTLKRRLARFEESDNVRDAERTVCRGLEPVPCEEGIFFALPSFGLFDGAPFVFDERFAATVTHVTLVLSAEVAVDAVVPHRT